MLLNGVTLRLVYTTRAIALLTLTFQETLILNEMLIYSKE